MKCNLFVITLLFAATLFGQQNGESISYKYYKAKSAATPTNFAVKGSLQEIIADASIHYKYSNAGWHFIRCTPNSIGKMMETVAVYQLYFNPAQPYVMNDTMRIVQNIDSVLNGEAPLAMPFTGQDVIIGYVDSGVDYLHEDFKNEDGSSRVLYYWDHSLGIDPERTPLKYGYGQ